MRLPWGATVFMNGIKIGKTPLTELYPIGKYNLKIEIENHEILEEEIEIRLPDTNKKIMKRAS